MKKVVVYGCAAVLMLSTLNAYAGLKKVRKGRNPSQRVVSAGRLERRLQAAERTRPSVEHSLQGQASSSQRQAPGNISGERMGTPFGYAMENIPDLQLPERVVGEVRLPKWDKVQQPGMRGHMIFSVWELRLAEERTRWFQAEFTSILGTERALLSNHAKLEYQIQRNAAGDLQTLLDASLKANQKYFDLSLEKSELILVQEAYIKQLFGLAESLQAHDFTKAPAAYEELLQKARQLEEQRKDLGIDVQYYKFIRDYDFHKNSGEADRFITQTYQQYLKEQHLADDLSNIYDAEHTSIEMGKNALIDAQLQVIDDLVKLTESQHAIH